jgi:hypothetical protein
MQDHSCGCKVDARFLDDRCREHALWECHKDMLPEGYAFIRNGRRCPPCFRASQPTVGLSPAISRLTYERIKGRPPDKRGRENY